MDKLNALKSSILLDGKIDASEVLEIKELIYADGKIDTAEADFLFNMNNECSDAENDPSWAILFVDAISSYLLEDEASPGEIDENESQWLLSQIQSDGKLDASEKKLLEKLRNSAKSMPDVLSKFIKENV